MKDKKQSFYNFKIIRHLISNDVTTIQEVADEVGLSEKTIRTRIDSINEFLEENDVGQIIRKPRVGIWIDASEEQIIKLVNLTSNFAMGDKMQEAESNSRDLYSILLKTYGGFPVSLGKLSNMFYFSKSTIGKMLKDLEIELQSYNLKLMTIRNKGVQIQGSEIDYRNALKAYIFDSGVSSIEEKIIEYFGFVDVHLLKKLIVETEDEWGINFDEYSFNQVLVTMTISITRARFSHNLVFEDSEKEILERYNEFAFAQSLLKKITNYTGIELSSNDLNYLAIHILCSRFIESDHSYYAYNSALEYDRKLYVVVDKMIEIVGGVLNIDLSKDQTLFNGLVQHLRPMIFRLKYGLPQENSLINLIKKDYKHVYRAVWSVSILFEQYYGISITDNEIGFIAIYFEAATQRKMVQMEIVIVTKRNISYTQLLTDKISRSINNSQPIKIINNHDFRIRDHEHLDIILTTDNLDFESDKIVVVNDAFLDESIATINSKIDSLRSQKNKKITRFSLDSQQLFDPELIVTNLEVESKEEVISTLSTLLLKKNFVNANYEQTVHNHGAVAITEIGNGIAIPHGSQYEVNEAKVAIATLKEPVLWNFEKVDVVFLLAVKMTTQTEINKTQSFYRDYIHLISTDDKVNILRNMESNIHLYNYLIG